MDKDVMKAIVATGSGPPEVLQLREVPKPVPKDNEVLVRVHASTVTIGDVILRKLHPLLFIPLWLFGARRKATPGHEFAGEIEVIGRAVQHFKEGDKVFGTMTGLGSGANAEYVCLPEVRKGGVLALMPANATYEEAAAVPIGGMAALELLRKAKIQRGQNVLIYGASGSVGTFAVQLARYMGAGVTGVSSTSNLELVRSLRADQVIDYTREEIGRNGQVYDVIFDAVGKLPAAASKAALKDRGTLISVKSPTSEITEDLIYLRELIEAGRLRAVIDRRYPLEQTAEAHRYVDSGRKRGNVVITIAA